MTMRIINISHDFSRYPAGRFKADGPYSGEAFRDDILMKALASKESITVQLDGVRGFGSSFLEEAFGGLVRNGYTPGELKDRIIIETTDTSLREEIMEYINNGADPIR